MLGDRAAIMPIDPAGGGSWIGVNDSGLAAAVLNRHPTTARAAGCVASRGLIVRRALACDSIAAATDAGRALDANGFRPFRLVLVQRRRIAVVVSNGTQSASADATLERPYVFTASSFGDVFVDGPRRRLFDCFMNHAYGRRHGQWLFHRHQWADKRDISVLMDREDAATVSRTMVEVGARDAVLEYESLLPWRPAYRVQLPPC
jgi:hypothetical protein